MTVDVILNRKGRSTHTVDPSVTMRQFATMLVERNVGAMVCTDAMGGIVGIVTERDLARAIGRYADRALDMTVAQCMTRDVVACNPNDTLNDLLSIMSEARCRHLPVVRDGILVGMISIGDLVKDYLASRSSQ